MRLAATPSHTSHRPLLIDAHFILATWELLTGILRSTGVLNRQQCIRTKPCGTWLWHGPSWRSTAEIPAHSTALQWEWWLRPSGPHTCRVDASLQRSHASLVLDYIDIEYSIIHHRSKNSTCWIYLASATIKSLLNRPRVDYHFQQTIGFHTKIGMKTIVNGLQNIHYWFHAVLCIMTGVQMTNVPGPGASQDQGLLFPQCTYSPYSVVFSWCSEVAHPCTHTSRSQCRSADRGPVQCRRGTDSWQDRCHALPQTCNWCWD